jgi:hypothetical protein
MSSQVRTEELENHHRRLPWKYVQVHGRRRRGSSMDFDNGPKVMIRTAGSPVEESLKLIAML